MSYQSKCINDYGILRKYGNGTTISEKYKLVSLNLYRPPEDGKNNHGNRAEVNDEKLSNNIARARQAVFELSYCNPWDFFVTFTLDPQKYNRHDLPKWHKDLTRFICDYRAKHSVQLRYLLVPERHKDGAWHMHGFVMGLPLEHLREFSLADTIPYKIRNRLAKGKRVFTWEAYANKFGFADMEHIESQEAVSRYVTKYITEDLSKSITDLNAHMYYCSRGLERSEVILRDILTHEPCVVNYQGEFCKVGWFDDLEWALEAFN